MNAPEPTAPDVLAPAAASPTVRPPTWEAERATLLELLAHQQRVAQVGLVTSGLAHDVMNEIQVISGVAQIALLSGDREAARDALEKVCARCLDVAETTRALLQFVRRQDAPAPAVFSVETCLATAERLVAPLARAERVKLSRRVTDAPQARGDPRLLVQAVVNLASNAIRACAATHGTVELSASTPPDGSARVDVVDTGPGIPDAVRARIFRPFETGRATSGGNGLGLFIVRQALRGLGGAIRVRSSAAGTRFTLLLPRVAGPGDALPDAR